MCLSSCEDFEQIQRNIDDIESIIITENFKGKAESAFRIHNAAWTIEKSLQTSYV
ncbi:predicted protein [Botrytis cinerea T4]|uniref:Uncharacterized protein n=1 Tax=Botryotinia fuckeliana (strain T4) TaxID=999810 RepID=G2YHQ0_BOTF4|nr:predicted protein [Botrytis cinerea T4]